MFRLPYDRGQRQRVMMRRTLSAGFLAAFLGALAAPASALQTTLEDPFPANTKVRLETRITGANPTGMYFWEVDSIPHVHSFVGSPICTQHSVGHARKCGYMKNQITDEWREAFKHIRAPQWLPRLLLRYVPQ